jgi:hypothetical protein
VISSAVLVISSQAKVVSGEVVETENSILVVIGNHRV